MIYGVLGLWWFRVFLGWISYGFFNEDEDTSVFCLELLVAITLNNRDRIELLWQGVYEH